MLLIEKRRQLGSPCRLFLFSSISCTHSFLHRLGVTIIGDFNQLKPDVQGRNITAWSPVVAEVLQGFSVFDDKIVSRLV